MVRFVSFLNLLFVLSAILQARTQNCTLQIEDYAACIKDQLVNNNNNNTVSKRQTSSDIDDQKFEDASKYCMSQYSVEINAAVNDWAVGMKLEALDRLNPSMIAVATVTYVNADKVSITFDDWGNYYDYTTDKINPDLHPIGYAMYTHHPQNMYKPYEYPDGFNWKTYLAETDSVPVPFESFNKIQTNGMPKEFYEDILTSDMIQPGT